MANYKCHKGINCKHADQYCNCTNGVCDKPKIITLCGSTRFKSEFMAVQRQLTLLGYIVLSVGVFAHAETEFKLAKETKDKLDELHKRKIDISDEIFVINKDGYVGESTRSEIEYAVANGKTIKYLEVNDDKQMHTLRDAAKLCNIR